MDENKTIVAVAFSGGRDSSVAIIVAILKGYIVLPITLQVGAPELTGQRGDSAPEIRLQELRKKFPGKILERVIIENPHIIRIIALEKINKEHVVFPLALSLAVHTHAAVYCLNNGIEILFNGHAAYQGKKENYLEQSDHFNKLMKEFLVEFGVDVEIPLADYLEHQVKEMLERHGISSNSLENKSIFGGLDFEPGKAQEYWDGAISICREYINLMTKEN